MPWVSYRQWNGAVNGKRVRVPIALRSGIAAYGSSMNPLTMRAGTVGQVTNILAERSAKPDFVRFPGPLDCSFAAILTVRQADNPGVLWQDFVSAQMSGGEAQVVVPRKVLDVMEIEV